MLLRRTSEIERQETLWTQHVQHGTADKKESDSIEQDVGKISVRERVGEKSPSWWMLVHGWRREREDTHSTLLEILQAAYKVLSHPYIGLEIAVDFLVKMGRKRNTKNDADVPLQI